MSHSDRVSPTDPDDERTMDLPQGHFVRDQNGGKYVIDDSDVGEDTTEWCKIAPAELVIGLEDAR